MMAPSALTVCTTNMPQGLVKPQVSSGSVSAIIAEHALKDHPPLTISLWFLKAGGHL